MVSEGLLVPMCLDRLSSWQECVTDSLPGAQAPARDQKCCGAQPSKAGLHNLFPQEAPPSKVSTTSPNSATFYQSWGHSLNTEKPSLATCPGEAKLKETNTKKCMRQGWGGKRFLQFGHIGRGTRKPVTPSTPSSGSQGDIKV